MDDDRTVPIAGPVGRAVKADLEQMICSHPMREALSASALRLAHQIDTEITPRDLGSVAKEMRDTLNDLAGRVAGDDDDLADLLGPELSAEVRHTEEP